MIDRSAKLSLTRQAKVLGISRGSFYYAPRPVTDGDLNLMHRVDHLLMEFPFAGSRMLKGILVQEGYEGGRLHIAPLMMRGASRHSIVSPTLRNLRRAVRSTRTRCGTSQ